MRRSIQTVIQVVFLVLFIGLMSVGKIKFWMLIFLTGVLATLMVGRIYCGWICPINTVVSILTKIKRLLKIKDHPIPNWIKSPWIRYGLLALFLGLAVFANVSQRPVPILPALFALGILLTLFFPETLWHRYLCPYGTILRVPAEKSHRSLRIVPSSCTNCGACARICPTETIIRINHQYVINKPDCLVCYACQDRCSKDAIH